MMSATEIVEQAAIPTPVFAIAYVVTQIVMAA